MLNPLKKVPHAVLVLLVIIGATSFTTVAVADGKVVCDESGTCSTIIENGPTPGGGGNGGVPAGPGGGGSGGGSGGASTGCSHSGKDIPCTHPNHGVWDGANSCYVDLIEHQEEAPPWAESDDGAWYKCVNPADGFIQSIWLDSPPAAVERLTPAQAAARLIATYQFKSPQIKMWPTEEQNHKAIVGKPVWLWVGNSNDSMAWGPWTKSDTLGGVTVTAVAKVASVTWDMGDGNKVTCSSPGTPHKGQKSSIASPNCGHFYRTMSPNNGKSSYNITATSNWEITWEGGGDSGSERTTTQSSTTISVGEVQTILKK